VVGFEQEEQQVRLLLYNGTSVTGDVLAGADGIGSIVRQQFLPDVKLVDTGRFIIYARSPLSMAVAELAPDVVIDLVHDHMMLALGFVGKRPLPPEEMRRVTPQQLHQIMLDITQSWHPAIHGMVERADVPSMFVQPMRLLYSFRNRMICSY
jgi:2-polyprenyl-6-methoxyphenol hydroxylase-like FAD-dependent oxidoreductase